MAEIFECDDCGFRYDAIHRTGDGTDTCPNCEEDRLRAQLSDANAKLAAAVGALEMVNVLKGTFGTDYVAIPDKQAFAKAREIALSTLPAQAAQMLAIVEIAREEHEDCQQHAGHQKRPDRVGPCQMCRALHDFDANRETTRTDRSDG